MKGVTIAFKHNKDKTNWKFGIILKLHEHKQVIDILIWKGGVNQVYGKFYPKYYDMNLNDLNSTLEIQGTKMLQWLDEFETNTFNMDDFIILRYLNQVDGMLPVIHLEYDTLQLPRTNPVDGCFQNSMLNLDYYMVPSCALFGIPQSSINNRPLHEVICDIMLPNDFARENANDVCKVKQMLLKSKSKSAVFYNGWKQEY